MVNMYELPAKTLTSAKISFILLSQKHNLTITLYIGDRLSSRNDRPDSIHCVMTSHQVAGMTSQPSQVAGWTSRQVTGGG